MAAEDTEMRWWSVDVRSRGRRRWMVVGCYLVLFVVIDRIGADGRWMMHPYLVFSGMFAAALVWERLSIFGKSGPVKSIRNRPTIRLGGLGELVPVTGLDERARYRFGVDGFEAASKEQQEELLNTHRIGTYWMQKDRDQTAPSLDEREQRDRDNAERWTLNQIVAILSILTGIWFSQMVNHGKLDGYGVLNSMFFVGVLALTLPKARMLWVELDPREFGGEMGLVAPAGS